MSPTKRLLLCCRSLPYRRMPRGDWRRSAGSIIFWGRRCAERCEGAVPQAPTAGDQNASEPRQCSRFSPAGNEVLHALDERVVNSLQAVAVLSYPDTSQKKLDDPITYHVLGGETKREATIQKECTISPKNSKTKVTKSQGRDSALRSSTENIPCMRRGC